MFSLKKKKKKKFALYGGNKCLAIPFHFTDFKKNKCNKTVDVLFLQLTEKEQM